MPTEPDPITLAQVVHRAIEVCDPSGTDDDLADFYLRFEDSDEPVTAIEDIEQRLAESAGALDPKAKSHPSRWPPPSRPTSPSAETSSTRTARHSCATPPEPNSTATHPQPSRTGWRSRESRARSAES
jgi:hypothetical protein